MAPTAEVIRPNSTNFDLEEAVLNIARLNTSSKKRDVRSSYKGGFADSWVEHLPSTTRTRLEKAGIDLSQGYPERPPTEDIPIFLDQAEAIRNSETPYIEKRERC